jgi:hypothetical protein
MNLWSFEMGVPDVWDEYKREHVTIKAVLIATITYLPGRGSLSEENTKGYTGCVECLDDPKNNSKIDYMGHCRFLPRDYSYRGNRKDFDGTIDKRKPPNYQDGHAILRELNKLEAVLGKEDNVVAAPDRSIWKKKISFLETTLLAISERTPLS